MNSNPNEVYIRNLLLSPLTPKLKKKFKRQYSKWNDVYKRMFYLQLFKKIQAVVVLDNDVHLNSMSWMIDFINTKGDDFLFHTCYQSEENPINNTNLVILATRCGKLKSLEYMFSRGIKSIFNLSRNYGRGSILPGDVDDENHTAFYYAMRKSDTALLSILTDKWPDDHFLNNSEELDEILSKAYKELKLRNVCLSNEMDVFVITKMVDLRFFTTSTNQPLDDKKMMDNIIQRIDFLLEAFDHIMKEWPNYEEVDEELLVVGEFIAKNIFTLKYQLKSTYDRIPWEEMEFCLIIFVQKYTEPLDTNILYSSILNKTKMVTHLENFSKALSSEKNSIQTTIFKSLKKYPKEQREIVKTQILLKYPQFKQLYSDYEQVRDFYSLELIKRHADLARSADYTKRDQLVTMRALQVIGECMKNSLESPKLSNDTREKLISFFQRDTYEVLENIRNALSKEDSLYLREHIAECSDSFFLNVRSDISKISVVITEILIMQKSKAIRNLFDEILDCKTIIDVKNCLGVFHFSKSTGQIAMKNKESQMKKNFGNHLDPLTEMVIDCSKLIDIKSHEVDEKFENIFAAIQTERQEMKKRLNIFYSDFRLLEEINQKIHNRICTDENSLIPVQWLISKAKENEMPVRTEESKSEVVRCLQQIVLTVGPNLEVMNLIKILKLCDQIVFKMIIDVERIKWIRELKMTVMDDRMKTPLSESQRTNLLSSKLSSLRKFFQHNKLFDCTVPYENNLKIGTKVDMLVLDIMSILKRKHLAHNPFFLDSTYPIAIGKNLRNHLAHGNILYNIFLPRDSVQILINARNVIEKVTDITVLHKIDKVIQCDISLLKDTHRLNLSIVRIQKKFYNVIKQGSIDDVKALIKEGADINCRNLKLWTTLHFAASNSDVKVFKFLWDKNLNENAKDIIGQSPLHIAAKFGRASTVEYLVKELKMSVDDADSNGKTPLHVSAEYGQVSVIEILLKHRASTTLKDKILGLTPTHYAFLNNHIEASKILLNDKDILRLETAGGHTLLHFAAEYGHLELVEILIRKNINLETKTDRCFAALHLAASNGFSSVVQALIKHGANANVKTIDRLTPLHCAVANRHSNTAEVLLKNGADANANNAQYETCTTLSHDSGYPRTSDYLLKVETGVRPLQSLCRTPLHFAARGGCVQSVKLLLQHKASIDAEDLNKHTALHLGARSGHKDVVQLLIDEKASVNCKDLREATPLHLATSNGHIDVVKILINNGAKVNEKDVSGNTALHLSVSHEYKDIVKLLIKKEADVSSKGVLGMTPLELAIVKNMSECFVNEGIDVRSVLYDDGRTALHEGVVSGNVKFVEYCIQSKCDVDAIDQEGTTALHLAVQLNEEEIITLLLNYGSNLDLKDCKGRTALEFAVIHGYKDSVEHLTERKAGICNKLLYLAVLYDHIDVVTVLFSRHNFHLNTDSKFSLDLLNSAIQNGNREISEILLNKGAETDVKTSREGYTPLHFAAHEGHHDVAKLLLSKNADPNVTSNDGDTPLHLAIRKGNTNVISVLLENDVDASVRPSYLKTAFELAVGLDNLQALKVLLSKTDADTNHRSEYTRTLLHIASQKGHFEILKYLITSFADVNAPNSDGLQPIHLASLNGHTNIVEYLLDHGSNIGDLGANQRTLLHYAAEGGHSSTLESVIQKGECTNCVDASGETPLHVAAKKGHASAFRTLLEHGSYYDVRDNNCKTPLEEATSPETVAILKSIERLFEAVKEGDASGVERLIKEGALPNAKCDENMTPLMYAAWKGFNNVVDVLLSGEADPNISGKHGFVALHYASQLPNGSCIVKSLLSKSAVYDYLSEEGKTPLDISDSRNDLLKTVDKMFDYVRKGRNCESDVLNCLNELTNVDELRAVVRARNREGKTLMAVAMCNDFSKMVDMKIIFLNNLWVECQKGQELLSDGRYEESFSVLNEVWKRCTDIFCSENPFVLDIREDLITIRMRQCNPKGTRSILEDIYQLREKTLGAGNVSTLKTKFWIGVALQGEGKIKEAIDVFEEVYRKLKAISKEQIFLFIQTEAYLEMMKSEENPCEKTLISLKRVYKKTHKEFPEYNLFNLDMQCRLADVYSILRKQEKAMKFYHNAYNVSKRKFGEYHSMTLNILSKHARSLCYQEKWDEALHSYEKVFLAQKETLGPSHPVTLTTQYEIGNTFYHEAKYLGALVIFREGLEQRKKIWGSAHPYIINTLEKIEFIENHFTYLGEEDQWLLKQVGNMFA